MDMSTKLVLALILHEVGDYCLQSDWMANEKTKNSVAALAHALIYTLPFLIITRSPVAISIIFGTHFVLDRFRLARYWCWLKNFLAPRETPVAWTGSDPTRISMPGTTPVRWWYPWSECAGTGYHKDRPPWMSVWLMIRADNAFHHLFNFYAIYTFGASV